MALSMLQRLASCIAKGANKPIHSTAKDVNKLAVAALICKDSRMVPNKGETEVITGRKLNEAKIIAIMGIIVCFAFMLFQLRYNS